MCTYWWLRPSARRPDQVVETVPIATSEAVVQGGWNDKDDNDHQCDDHHEGRNADRSRRRLTTKSPPGDHDCITHVLYFNIFLASPVFVVVNNDIPTDSSSSRAITAGSTLSSHDGPSSSKLETRTASRHVAPQQRQSACRRSHKWRLSLPYTSCSQPYFISPCASFAWQCVFFFPPFESPTPTRYTQLQTRYFRAHSATY